MHDKLSHIDDQGYASMVDISDKPVTKRTAVASGLFVAKEETLDAMMSGTLPKGEAIAVARVAGIQAAKQCNSLIPLCHQIPLEFVGIEFDRITSHELKITATTIVLGRTGIEMESLTAVSVAALTLWDMTKSIDKDLRIEDIRLLEKKKEHP